MHVNKPPYRVPTMQEINALPYNGKRVVSFFSGCGGSSLGYRMAGYRVIYANEFIPAAQDTYRANFPTTYLDTRDIRDVTAQDLFAATGLCKGELDLLDGSPPCASFSSAGTTSAGWKKQRQYSDTKQRVDDLFHEYVRLVSDIQPKVFVAENVTGLARGVAKGFFIELVAAFQKAGYVVSVREINAALLGVPQKRKRLIFVGVRRDLKARPAFPKPFAYTYTLYDACPHITLLKAAGKYEFWVDPRVTTCGTIAQSNGKHPSTTEYMSTFMREAPNADGVLERKKFTIEELKRICAFPDDFILTGTFAQQWERLGRAVPPVMMQHIARAIYDNILKGA